MKNSSHLTKEEICNFQLDKKAFQEYVATQKDKDVIYLLKKLGKLDTNFNGKEVLVSLTTSTNKNIRLEAVLNLAKLVDIDLLPLFLEILDTEEISEIRKETASAIGRLRNEMAIPILFDMLEDYDPNVILQAIRGLLVFKKNKHVEKHLISLSTHKNEIIRQVIDAEFNIDETTNSNLNHIESPNFLHNTVVNGDVLEVLKHVPDESIHLTFTSPPYYNARDYSIYKSYDEYLDCLKQVFEEVHRITKEGRFFIINTSPIIISRVGRKYSSKRYPIPYDLHCIFMQMGWEFIDDIIWSKPEASAKNRISGFNQHRKPLTYKPNCTTESIMVYRKKTHKLIDWNIKQYPTDIIEKSKVLEDYETSNVWKIDPVFDKVHSAVFPMKLCDNVIKYYSFIGDLVFDPFGGSGTFGKSAIKHNRKFFLTEKDAVYFERIKENLDQTTTFISIDDFIKKGDTNDTQ